ncbi:MAG: hypothetical protein J6X06_03800 [Elusimicrobiaceae bacterium]|nr:hypothetical protein [Elusimicrobiaceae bacterium]
MSSIYFDFNFEKQHPSPVCPLFENNSRRFVTALEKHFAVFSRFSVALKNCQFLPLHCRFGKKNSHFLPVFSLFEKSA